ncbi:hypothetical protein OG234_13610 [Streptomyces sp. NBC_01420]|uniref:hypothetical protein n=1 Tax=Streptomyces sp. NBC_01420 TaxID=2903858 RepID=UPI0032440884
MSAWTREHCVCTEVQNLSYDEAASRLGIVRSWLEDHISKLPHMKFGKNPSVFCMCDLRVINAMQSVVPAEAQAVIRPTAATTTPQTAAPAYAALRPSGGRKRTPAGV